jgi:hypothetical protein
MSKQQHYSRLTLLSSVLFGSLLLRVPRAQ